MTGYFNYFTAIEEHFQQARGTSLFLLSPLDWALIETWKNSEVPLEAVLRGVDAAFEKWRTRKIKTQAVNSLAYCAQAVLTEAQRLADGPAAVPREKSQEAPFPEDEIQAFLMANAKQIRETAIEAFAPVVEALDRMAAQLTELTNAAHDLEDLEQRLTALQGKLIALARSRQSEDEALAARRDMEGYLRPYRSKMTAPQLAMLEMQFLERNTLDRARLPHLSLFYLR